MGRFVICWVGGWVSIGFFLGLPGFFDFVSIDSNDFASLFFRCLLGYSSRVKLFSEGGLNGFRLVTCTVSVVLVRVFELRSSNRRFFVLFYKTLQLQLFVRFTNFFEGLVNQN